MPRRKRTTPTGAAIQAKELTEDFDVGYRRHSPLDSSFALFWNVGESSEYLRRKNVRAIPISTFLEMLVDYRIAIAETFIKTPLVNAPWRIEHPDDDVTAFLNAVWEPLHDRFFRTAVKAVMLGWLPLVKHLEFRTPRQTDAQRSDGIEPWRGAATPVIVPKIEVLSPAYARAHISKRGKFTGIDLTLKVADDGRDVADIGLNNTVWVVRGQEDAFGDLYGQGRLVTGYGPWWDGTFLGALFMRHCERAIDPAVVVKHPPGYSQDPNDPDEKGTKWSVKAMEAGQALRSGATVTICSVPYRNEEDGTYTSIPQWDIDTSLATLENVDAFDTVLTRKDADILLGVLIPPAAISSKYAKETLGGKSMVEILQDLAVKLLLGEWETIANAAETWVLNWLVRANFGERGDAQLVTDGFSGEDEEALRGFIADMLKTSDTITQHIDERELVKRSGLPLREEEVVAPEQPPSPEEQPSELEAALAHDDAYTEEQLQERAQQMVQQTSAEMLDGGDWRVTQADMERAVKVWGELPEVKRVEDA